MLHLRKLTALRLLAQQPRYFFFDSNPQSSFSSEDEEAKLQKIFKTFENNQSSLTPQKLVEYLDRFVIGQHQAKKAIACAFRNRWRRKDLPGNLKAEITPKNLLIKGPTGCGKTEIARRLAKLTNSPFIRVEATKYTEVGYVGKDVSSIIQDNEDRSQQLQGQARPRLEGTQRTHQARGGTADTARHGRGGLPQRAQGEEAGRPQKGALQ